jgi:hypothetical protein
MTSILPQILIPLTGVTAIWLTQSPNENARRYACLFGLAAQPFWFWATWEAQQWGIFAVSILYTASWLRGFRTHWLKPKPTPERKALERT